jgi:hypothetical protein
MAEWTEVNLNAKCTPAADRGTVRMPRSGPAVKGKRVLIKAGDKEKLFKVDRRADGGGGACVAPTDFAALGDPEAVQLREVGLVGATMRDDKLRRSALIALLTPVGAVLTAITTLEKSGAAPSDSFTGATAFVVLAVATLLAFLKFRDEWTKL